jgi:hypothetical protein
LFSLRRDFQHVVVHVGGNATIGFEKGKETKNKNVSVTIRLWNIPVYPFSRLRNGFSDFYKQQKNI